MINLYINSYLTDSLKKLMEKSTEGVTLSQKIPIRIQKTVNTLDRVSRLENIEKY